MRWSIKNENLLWRIIFQTQDLTLELDKVSEAWPGDNKPTPINIKKRLDKYCKRESNITLSMGSKGAAVTPSPRKPCVTKKTAKSSSPAVSSVGTGTPGAGAGRGRGRGRPRKTPMNVNVKVNDDLKEPDALEPPSKKMRVEEDISRMFGIQVPLSPLSFGDANKENAIPGVDGIHKSEGVTKHAKGNNILMERSFNAAARMVKVEDTEEYARCGQEVDCKGTCCGERYCLYCFGEWDGEFRACV